MTQMCPNCSFDNANDTTHCTQCATPLQGLLAEKSTLSERYKIMSVLGYGAMGAVYLAEDVRLVGRRCAVKENRPNATVNVDIQAQSREQFLAEASILARLDHANLPKVSDYFIENDREYLVMDYIEGEDLDSYIQRAQAPLSEALVLNWADQVLDALHYLHNQKPQPIVHRDIKPANIRVNLEDRVRLVDFGLVKVMDTENPATKVELRGLGTPAYAPLEQFADSESHTDPRSDLYSMGATIYHLLTHLYPPDVHQRVLTPTALLPPHELNLNLSKKTEAIVLKAMAIHPDERYQTAKEMRQEIIEARQSLAVATPVPIPPAAKKSLWGGLTWFLIALVIVLLILGVVAFILLGQEQSPPPTEQVAVVVEVTQEAIPAPTEVLQSLGDAPTDTPTVVIKVTTAIAETSTPTEEPTVTSTPETLTPEPTQEPQAVQPAGILADTLKGIIAYPVFDPVGNRYNIYFGQVDASGTQLFQENASQPAFSPTGPQIAFRSWKQESLGIIVSNLEGTQLTRVTQFAEDQLPTWQANGSQLVLLSRREGDRGSRLYNVDGIRTGNDGTTFNEGEYPTIGLGGQLVFKGWGVVGLGLRLAASPPFDKVQPLTDFNADTAPAISPDGQKIVFMADKRDNNWEIYSVNADGSGLQRLTENLAQDGLPTWSPDGRAIAFVSDRDGVWAIWAMAPDGSNQQQLFQIEGSPNGIIGNDKYVSRGWAEERISWTQ